MLSKVAIYARLSQEDRNKMEEGDDSQSIQNQKLMLINYSREHDWEIYHIYSDDDYTGADRNRPGFVKLLKDAKAKKFDIILCKSQSRFTRELELVEKYLHGLFPMWGIRFISIVDNADTMNKANKKSRQINGLVNEWYLEDMSDNIRITFKSKCKQGKHIGSFACYGYIKDPDNKGNIIIDEDAAKTVRLIYNLYEQGNGQIRISKILNEKGIPNPSTYKKLKGMKFKVGNSSGKSIWGPETIRNILNNQMYIGNMVQHTKENISYKVKKQRRLPKDQWIIKQGTHEPIITKDQYDKIQRIKQNRPRAQKDGGLNKYAGILKCMSCASAMSTTKYKDYRYFRCRAKLVSKDCIGSTIRQDVLDEIIIKEFQKMKKQYLCVDYLEKQIEIEGHWDRKMEDLQHNIADLKQKIKKNKEIAKQLYLDKVNAIILEAEYIEFSKTFFEERKILKKNMKDMVDEIEYRKSQKMNIVKKMDLIHTFNQLESVNRDMIISLIDKIEVGNKDEDTGVLPLKIHWKF